MTLARIPKRFETLPEAAKLRSYFTVFKKDRLLMSSEATRQMWRLQFTLLDKFLKRPALVTDLTDDTLQAVMQWMIQRGQLEETAHNFHRHICNYWRYLHRKRIVSTLPAVRPSPKVKRPRIESAIRGTLMAQITPYADSRPRPIGRAALKHLEVNVARFSNFLERPALVTDLTDENVAAAMLWIVNNRRAVMTANQFRYAILALWEFLARQRIVEVFPTVRPLLNLPN